jgi:hypothetical protein
MSAMFDYISGKASGEIARAEASLEHALGCLGAELEENERLRAKLDQITAVCDDNAGPSCDAHMALKFIRQITATD